MTAMSHDWKEYAQQGKGFPPRETVTYALRVTQDRNRALDIGAGGFNEVRFLSDNHFKEIDVLDIEPYSLELAKEYKNVNVIISPIEEYTFPPNYYDLISTMYIIPFVDQTKHQEILLSMYNSLTEGGVIAFNLFGAEHSWKKGGVNKEMHFYTKEEAMKLQEIFPRKVALSERRFWANKQNKEIFWHTFEYIVRKA